MLVCQLKIRFLLQQRKNSTVPALFGIFNEDRAFPFLLLDASRSHPEYLARYRERLYESAKEVLEEHIERLRESVPDGNVIGMFETVLSLSYTPFLHVPFLKNVAGYSEQQVNEYLQRREEEMLTLLQKRYSKA